MKIGIIGAGYIGGTAAKLFVEAGHEVTISNSRGPETLRNHVERLGANAHAGTPQDAARFGDIVLLAVPLKDYVTVPAEELRGKIVMDALNYYPDRDGQIASLDSGVTTSSEMVAAHLTGSRLVKAFNTIWFEHLKTQGRLKAPLEERRAIFISGDHADAKQIVAQLISDIGFGAYDLGSLANSAEQKPGAAVYNRDVTVAAARNLVPR